MSATKRLALATIPAFCGSLGCVDSGDPEAIEARVLPFRNGARGAYSIVHDDLCDVTTSGLFEHAGPELEARGLVAGFGVIGHSCEVRALGEQVRELADAGHEIVNHSWTHPALVPCDNVTNEWQSCSETRPDYAVEIDQTRSWVEENVGVSVDFFIYPYDSFDDESVEYLRDRGYLGARAGERGFTNPDDFDPLRIEFDTYGPEWSIYKGAFDRGEVDEILDVYVEDAIDRGEWALREFHGVEDRSWESVPLGDYTAHLDHVAELVEAGDLWMDSPTAVVRYLMTRAHCGTPSVTGHVMTFAGADDDCSRYRTKVTVELTRENLTVGLTATQDGIVLPTWSEGDYTVIVADVNPMKPVELDFDGVFSGRGDD